MAELIGPIVIRYDGLDAEQHQIDLDQLGESLRGAARLIAVAGNIVMTGRYVSKIPAMSVKVLAGEQRANCYEIAIYLAPYLGTVATPLLPLLSSAGLKTAEKAIEAVVNYFLKKIGGSSSEAEKAMELAKTCIEANRDVSIKTVEAMAEVTKAALDSRPAARAFAAPVGRSTHTAMIGAPERAAVIDARMKAAIDDAEPIEIGDTRPYVVQISELDVLAGTCKVALEGDDADGPRISGHITDPVVGQPRNPYSNALDSQAKLTVMAKAHLRAGAIEKLTISDIAPPVMQ